MRTTFSVMLSMVRSFRTGTEESPGPVDDMLDLFCFLVFVARAVALLTSVL